MSFSINITVDTTKLDSIIKNLKMNAELVGKRVIGPKAEGLAKMYAPVDTGLLRSSIEQAFPGDEIIARVQLLAEKCNYGIFQELGTYKMAAHPFFTPMAYDMAWVYSSPGTWEPLFK